MALQNEMLRQMSATQQQVDNIIVPEMADDLISPFLALPGLRGFWPMSSFDSNGDCYDLSDQDRTLSYNGNPQYGFANIVPYITLDGTGDYLDRTDEAGLDILGTETYVTTAARGLTIGCWTRTSAASTEQSIFGKWHSVGDNRSYNLKTTAADRFQFQITNLGTLADIDAVTDSVDYDTAAWYFIVGRFDPSTAIYIDVNGRSTTLAAGIPASLFNSTADLVIGAANNGGTFLYTGYVSCAFLCATYLSDAIVSSLYQQTRAAFGI